MEQTYKREPVCATNIDGRSADKQGWNAQPEVLNSSESMFMTDLNTFLSQPKVLDVLPHARHQVNTIHYYNFQTLRLMTLFHNLIGEGKVVGEEKDRLKKEETNKERRWRWWRRWKWGKEGEKKYTDEKKKEEMRGGRGKDMG